MRDSLNLLCDNEAINTMLCEVNGKRVADSHVTSTMKVPKSIISDVLDGTRTCGKQDWQQPCYIIFSMATHTKRGSIDHNQWNAMKHHH